MLIRLLKLTPPLLGRGLFCPAVLWIDEILRGADKQPWFLVVAWPQFSHLSGPGFKHTSPLINRRIKWNLETEQEW